MSSQAKKMHRTLLFAPGSRTELLTKAQLGAADAMIFDLEDSVPLNAKDEARKNIQEVLGLGLKKPMYLRISNPRAGDYVADLGVFHNHSLFNVAGVALPKADDAHDIETVSKALQVIEIKAGVAVGSLSILPMIETCLGLRNSFDIAKSSKRVSGMALASAEQGDFMVDLGGHWTPRSLALTYPRSKLVVDSRAAGVEWIVDGVFMNLKDTQMLREECLIARELGFVGKMAIHPTQVDVMHEVFSPSAEEIEYARGLIAAFREGEARGVGAVKYEGMMVDYANVRLAERTLALVESL